MRKKRTEIKPERLSVVVVVVVVVAIVAAAVVCIYTISKYTSYQS
jgi:hypothetical protein